MFSVLAPQWIPTEVRDQELPEFKIPLGKGLKDRKRSVDVWYGFYAVGPYCADRWFPRNSWPWTLTRQLTFVMSGKSQFYYSDIRRLIRSRQLGPIGARVVLALLAKANKRYLAMDVAELGLSRLTDQAFMQELNMLLDPRTPLGRFAMGTLALLQELNESEMEWLVSSVNYALGEDYA